MRTRLLVIAVAASLAFIFQAQAQTAEAIFPKGELSPAIFAYIAVTPTQKGKTIWLEPVSDNDYRGLK